jgi:dihydroorotase
MSIVLRQGLIVGPTSSSIGDVLIIDGTIADVGPTIDAPSDAVEVDVRDCWVGPGFVDLHTHLREPGREAAENIESGARAGALGGYCALVAMPNTEPCLDNVAAVSYVLARGATTPLDICVAGAITQGRRGEALAPMAEMAALGVRLFSDDGVGVQDPSVMRRALRYAKPLGVRLAQHCEDEQLAGGGTMNEGVLSGRLGLTGRPALAEELMVMRDIELVRATGAEMHFLHLSTARSIALVVAARAEGLPVTFEVAPHHFTLDEECCAGYDPAFKVHPPLRTKDDVTALVSALRRGDVDAVASDHAPHAPELKDLPFDEAPAGMLGLEHAASLTYEALGAAQCDPALFYRVLSRGPAAIARLRREDAPVRHSAHGGSITVGEDANLTVFSPSTRWTVHRDELASRSMNTPYDGRELLGRVRATIAKGRLVVNEGTLT